MTVGLDPEEVEKITFTESEESLLKTHLLNGSRTKVVEVLGHSILLRTISVREELEVISLIKEWEDTRGFSKAFKTAVLAASIVTIDGEPLYTPFSTEEKATLPKKFEKVGKFYPLFVNKIYEGFRELEEDTDKLLQKLTSGKD